MTSFHSLASDSPPTAASPAHPLSPLTSSSSSTASAFRNWPTASTAAQPTAMSPTWQCFMPGSKIRFLLPNTNTPWQKAEELAWKDRLASKVDSRNAYQYAPNGLSVLKVRNIIHLLARMHRVACTILLLIER